MTVSIVCLVCRPISTAKYSMRCKQSSEETHTPHNKLFTNWNCRAMVVIVDASYHPRGFGSHDCRYVGELVSSKWTLCWTTFISNDNYSSVWHYDICSNPRSNFQVCGQGMKCIEGECAQTVHADVACRAALFGPANLGRPELFPVTAFQVRHRYGFGLRHIHCDCAI